jgi:vacuolar iron transporter family protein
MGLGGFLAAQSELEHYKSEKRREEREVIECPDEEEEECYQVLAEYGVTREVIHLYIKLTRLVNLC